MIIDPHYDVIKSDRRPLLRYRHVTAQLYKNGYIRKKVESKLRVAIKGGLGSEQKKIDKSKSAKTDLTSVGRRTRGQRGWRNEVVHAGCALFCATFPRVGLSYVRIPLEVVECLQRYHADL